MIIRQEKNQQQNQTKQVDFPVDNSGLFGEKRDDFEDDELKEIAGESKDDAEDDLNEDAFLFVLFVETTVEEPETRPTE